MKINDVLLIALLLISSYIILMANSYINLNGPITTRYPTYMDDGKFIVRKGSEDLKILAITFDDGPHPRITKEILKTLDEYDIKATFFMLGKNVENYPKVVEQVYKEGHEIGNHTYSHIDVKACSESKIKDEIQKTQALLESITNTKHNLFRPPFGYHNKKILKIVKENDCRIVLWSDVDSKDWSNPGVNHIVKEIMNKVKNGDILLFHDYVEGKSDTAEALKIIIPKLKEKGYEFVTVSKLMELSCY